MNLWLLITISTDEEYSSTFCSGGDGGGGTTGCCPSCVWIFGVVFLFLTLVVGGLSHLYQCVILHRLSSESVLACLHTTSVILALDSRKFSL